MYEAHIVRAAQVLLTTAMRQVLVNTEGFAARAKEASNDAGDSVHTFSPEAMGGAAGSGHIAGATLPPWPVAPFS